MPAKTRKQYRAMQAAAHGKSTIGITAKVGDDFVHATSPEKRSEWSRKSNERAKAKFQ